MNSTASAGLVVGSRFVLERRIALGGMGQVWEATDQVLERPVAVKVLRQDLVESGNFLTRFRVEARLAAGLSHPGIAHVYDYAEDDHDGERVAFLVMELVDGQPLSDRLGRPDPLTLPQVVSILGQTAEALGAAHQLGIVHRDVKPGNLLITADGRVKVTDFGIARAIEAASITEVGEVIGTVRYMSPEQAIGQEATPASDVYSLAVVGYEMLSAGPPFTGDSPAAIALAHVQAEPPALPASVPDGLRSLIERALSKLPEDRPSDGAAFATALHEIAIEPAPQSVRPTVPTAATPLADSSPRRPEPIGELQPTAVLPLGATLPQLTAQHREPDADPDGTRRGHRRHRDRPDASPTPPPLSATPVLGDGWVAAHRRQRRLAVWGTAAAAVLVCLLVLIGFNRTGDFGDASATGSSVAESTVAPSVAVELVTVDPAAYRGLNETDARTALSAAGLTAVTTTGPSTADLTGLVVDVQPNGPLAVGSNVTIVLGDGTVAPAADPSPAGGGGNGGGGNGGGGEGKEKGKPKD